MQRAIVLLSGGLDSATTLALATQSDYACYAISFAYGQRHAVELDAARRIATQFHVAEHRVVTIDLAAFGGSALTDHSIPVPELPASGIPVTYVPARNTIFLAYALGWAETLPARHIFIGVNAVDYSGYPDCRPEFIAAFQQVANLGTKAGVSGDGFSFHTPLIDLSKAEIIRQGHAAGVDFAVTVSCYQPDGKGRACGRCDSCRLRAAGFAEAGIVDPTRYQSRSA
jgi:7-cyano-7-deazaguanine synthase